MRRQLRRRGCCRFQCTCERAGVWADRLLRARTHRSRAPPLPPRLVCPRRDLEKFGLAPFEVAQLGNLCPETAQEAKALIPSLAMPDREIDNSQLKELLEQLNSFKQYPT